MSGAHLSAAMETIIEQRDQARDWSVKLENDVERLTRELDVATSRLGVVETELQAANEIIAELRDNVVHMEGSDGNCLACCQPWMCDGYYADVSIGGVS